PVLRALLVALNEWVSEGRRPPRSRLPRRSDGTLVEAVSQERVGFPDIPGVTYNGLMTTGDLFDFGPLFDGGILTVLPPHLVGSPYPVFVPTTDDDGNDLAGIRLPDVAVPLATYTGWALRGAAFAGDDLCDGFGQKIEFQQTKADRLAVGDPRLSIEERYKNHGKYVAEVTRSAVRLWRSRLLLDEDVQRYIAAAEASAVVK
ncbi:MAG: alpha/beta hydrolase domain-containing protein, partial [Vicinamibacterales bacterium]